MGWRVVTNSISDEHFFVNFLSKRLRKTHSDMVINILSVCIMIDALINIVDELLL